MTKAARPFAASLLWTLIGAVALVLTTAGITVVVTSVRTNAITSQLLARIDKLSDDNAAAVADRRDLADQNEHLIRQNQHLIRQNVRKQEQFDALVRYLREHGFAVPPRVVAPSVVEPPGPLPKGTGPRGPNPSTGPQSHPRPSPSPSPRPTTGTTTAPTTPAPAITDLTCILAPLLCPRR